MSKRNIGSAIAASIAALACAMPILASAQSTPLVGGAPIVGLTMCGTKTSVAYWRVGANNQWGDPARVPTYTRVSFYNYSTKQRVYMPYRPHAVGHPLSGTEYFAAPAVQSVQAVPIGTQYWTAQVEVHSWNANLRRYDIVYANIPKGDGSFWCPMSPNS